MADDQAREAARALPFGYISLDNDGIIKRYNPIGGEEASPEADQVLGKHFFREVFRFPEIEKLEQKKKRRITIAASFRYGRLSNIPVVP